MVAFVSHGSLPQVSPRLRRAWGCPRMTSDDRQYDVMIYGATGSVGLRTAKYLARHAPKDLRWAIAGRDRRKLESVRSELVGDGGADGIGIVVGESDDIEDVVRRTKVFATTVGPYVRLGEAPLRACVDNRTIYMDICGELQFMRRMIDTYSAQAQQNSVPVLLTCGFDCIPADLGAFFVAEHAKEKLGCGLREVTACYFGYGGLGSATIASLLGLIGEDEGLEPYALQTDLPDPAGSTEPFPDLFGTLEVPEVQRHGAPFFLSPANCRIVRRSVNMFAAGRSSAARELDGSRAYSPRGRFLYREMLGVPSVLAPVVSAIDAISNLVVGGATKAMADPENRRRILGWFEDNAFGPADLMVATGFMEITYVAKTDEPQPRTIVAKQRTLDPGYAETSKLLAESAMLAAREYEQLPMSSGGGGFYTPATAFGHRLIDVLNSRSNWIEIVSSPAR